ncbi:MAG: hypothetical protein ACD_56C00093G0017 [uncultured bacterium]|nr:MAG: hypothetical protein ACD_56C00093G0017 [uncultured bacterium]
MQPTNLHKNLRLSSLRRSAQSAQIIREIEWNRCDVSHSLDAETLSFLLYCMGVFILGENLKSKI